jgi:MFS family permease
MMKEEGESSTTPSSRLEEGRGVSIANQNHSNGNGNGNGNGSHHAHHRVGGAFQPLELELEDDNRSEDSEYLATSLLPALASKWDNVKPQVYFQRWVQLGYLSLLALMSDWICFSTAASPQPFQDAYGGHSSASLIDLFLFVNVGSSFLVTDVVSKFGLQRSVKAASVLMGIGAWCRSVSFYLNRNYPLFVLGTILVGAAQPFFQCTPPLLSAHWFASDERATSTAVALNFNQIGIATAFLVGGQMGSTPGGLQNYFLLIAILCTVVSMGTLLQFQNKPPIPPSTSEMEKVEKGETAEPPFLVSARNFFRTPGFCRPLVAFICSISITNIVGVRTEKHDIQVI